MPKSLLYQRHYKINEHITMKIPLVGDIVDDDGGYYAGVSMIVSTPYDMMVQLADAKIDFTDINDWDLFCMLFNDMKEIDTTLIFEDLNLKDFHHAVNLENGNIILKNEKTGAVIDRAIHGQMSAFLRKVLCIERNDKRPANKEAMDFMIERARKKQQRLKRRNGNEQSQLDNYIVALVNTPEFPYDYQSVLDITIYQFYSSLKQIIHKVKFDNLMIGCYAGTVNVKEINPKELCWITN